MKNKNAVKDIGNANLLLLLTFLSGLLFYVNNKFVLQ